MSNISYKDAGVNIDTGNEFVEAIKSDVKSTFDNNVIGGIGSFAGAYALPLGYKEPVILSATDGVGTKLKVAIESNKLDTVGIDLVAMCVNDLICNHGIPMFFLDYYATGKLLLENAKDVVSGIAEGCRRSECALVGGETAEMPGMYLENDFDLAGFAVGIAERSEMDTISNVKSSQILVAIPSSGIHSNGYSLVRKLFFDKLGMSLETEFEGKPLLETLLEPTRIYVKEYKANKQYIKALAHITGGGIIENLPRILPKGIKAVIKKDNIQTLPIFEFMEKYVDEEEMFRTFNMGIGMVWVVEPEDIDSVLVNTDGYIIGYLEAGDKGVKLI
ncbi:MAG: phosphoribosylformylglycinamidine cyclo-ligase [Sulfurovum sp.]|nr:phosphoribosylformylglycinamidine cyclo-ligase [Sulfurovum sp.]MCB4745069.1 phosphoribosylformylglycinamidine cyclo-ligase [Sulfurovum sp.]MCB4745852.1 phosphoribosylformylglycinamidine cyclo-ligase [Sulfurovum sp.]MCB4746975.1 phosphoribosylformylglycinamidine cyclo-ligase [Sulfurovum sp.]MCB4748856.1 phosphoribosylformylglycinamidine cyclo-ligase [Sulfurovum sp.]